MKKIISLFSLVLILSCSSDDDNPEVVNQEYLDQLLGTYELKAAYLENPTDLNGDGIEGTNFYEEIEYCGFTLFLDSYDCTIVDRTTYQKISFDISYSNYTNDPRVYIPCMRHQNISSDIIIDSVNESVSLNILDYQEEFMVGEFKTKILNFSWEDRIAYLTLEQEFFKPNGEWETVIMNLEYEWYRSET